MPQLGPIYCETPAVISNFPAEQWNTWSNLIIILLGITAAVIVARRAPRSAELWVLAALLIGNGIGSFLWHALRTPWALSLDTLPGVLFLLAFVYVWSRRFLGTGRAWLFLGGFFVLALLFSAGSLILFPGVSPFIPLAPVVIAAAWWLIAKTARMSRRAAARGGAALASALAALLFRSTDIAACAYFPHGTHFLWHGFLSLAAFLGVFVILELKKREQPPERRRPGAPDDRL